MAPPHALSRQADHRRSCDAAIPWGQSGTTLRNVRYCRKYRGLDHLYRDLRRSGRPHAGVPQALSSLALTPFDPDRRPNGSWVRRTSARRGRRRSAGALAVARPATPPPPEPSGQMPRSCLTRPVAICRPTCGTRQRALALEADHPWTCAAGE